jgi:hypothetical protein
MGISLESRLRRLPQMGISLESRLRRLPQAGISPKVVCGGCRKQEFLQKSFAAAAANGKFTENRLRRLPQTKKLFQNIRRHNKKPPAVKMLLCRRLIKILNEQNYSIIL